MTMRGLKPGFPGDQRTAFTVLCSVSRISGPAGLPPVWGQRYSSGLLMGKGVWFRLSLRRVVLELWELSSLLLPQSPLPWAQQGWRGASPSLVESSVLPRCPREGGLRNLSEKT